MIFWRSVFDFRFDRPLKTLAVLISKSDFYQTKSAWVARTLRAGRCPSGNFLYEDYSNVRAERRPRRTAQAETRVRGMTRARQGLPFQHWQRADTCITHSLSLSNAKIIVNEFVRRDNADLWPRCDKMTIKNWAVAARGGHSIVTRNRSEFLLGSA